MKGTEEKCVCERVCMKDVHVQSIQDIEPTTWRSVLSCQNAWKIAIVSPFKVLNSGAPRKSEPVPRQKQPRRIQRLPHVGRPPLSHLHSAMSPLQGEVHGISNVRLRAQVKFTQTNRCVFFRLFPPGWQLVGALRRR